MIVRPVIRVLFVEPEVAPVRAVRRYVRPLGVIILGFIYPFPVHPFIERTAMVEHTVQYDLHSPPVKFFHQPYEELVAGFQVPAVGRALLVLARFGVIGHAFGQDLSSVFQYHSVVRVDIIIILDIIFMVRRRYEQRVEVQHLDSELLQIIQLIHDPFQVSPIKFPYPHRIRVLVPVRDLPAVASDIEIFI